MSERTCSQAAARSKTLLRNLAGLPMDRSIPIPQNVGAELTSVVPPESLTTGHDSIFLQRKTFFVVVHGCEDLRHARSVGVFFRRPAPAVQEVWRRNLVGRGRWPRRRVVPGVLGARAHIEDGESQEEGAGDNEAGAWDT